MISPSNHTVSISQKSDKLGGGLAWLMWFVAQLFALFQFSLQLSSGAMIKDLMHSFALTACGGGVLSSVYYYIYVSLQTPAGILLDRFGPRRLLSMSALMCGLGCFIFSQAQSLTAAILGRLLMGGGGAFAFVGMLTILVRWFPPRRFTLMVALVESLGMLSSMGGGVYLATIIQGVGWHECMRLMAFLLFAIAPLLWLVVRDEPVLSEVPAESLARIGSRQVPFMTFLKSLKFLLTSKAAWANAAYSGLTFGILSVFGALWGVPFLQLKYHLSLTSGVLLANMLFAGAAVGCPLMSFLDNRIQNRSKLLAVAALIAGILLAIIIFADHLSLGALVVLLLLTGIAASGYVISFTVGKEIVTPALHSTSLGFVNTLSVAAAPLFQPLVGLVMDILVLPDSDNKLHYSLSDYKWALATLVLAQLIAIFLAFKIPSKQNSGHG